jgi:tetratricopeptide (TPR) repeat protein
MKQIPWLILILGIVFISASGQKAEELALPKASDAGQIAPAQSEALGELKEAERAYHEGNFLEAQLHSERAMALDPTNDTAPLLVARTLYAQYKRGDETPANMSKAREAIAAYQRILAVHPENDEAYKAIAFLYGVMKEYELQRHWIFQRAADTSVSPEKRAEAYIVLAGKDWNCSLQITELPVNKSATVADSRLTVRYIKPKDKSDFEQARQCAASGLQMAEMAIGLTSNNESAWAYKMNLLLEMSKLAEMDNEVDRKTELMKQYRDAQRHTIRFADPNTDRLRIIY